MKELTQFLQNEGFYDICIEDKDKLQSGIWVDFNSTDKKGRVRLNCKDTLEDISQQKVFLQPGVKILIYQDETETEGTVIFSEEEEIWVAKVDWLELIEKNNQKTSS